MPPPSIMKRPHDEGADQPAEDHACKLRRLSVTVPAFPPGVAAAKCAAGGAAGKPKPAKGAKGAAGGAAGDESETDEAMRLSTVMRLSAAKVYLASGRNLAEEKPEKFLSVAMRLSAANVHLAHWHKVIDRESFQLSSHEEGDRHQAALLAAPWVPRGGTDPLEEAGPGTPVVSASGVQTAYYDPSPDIDRLHIKLWLPHFDIDRLHNFGAISLSCRYISMLDAQHHWTINDLKGKIVDHELGTLTESFAEDAVGDMEIFFRGQRLADEAPLCASGIGDDTIVHACTRGNAQAVEVASKHLSSWLDLLLRAQVK